MNKEEGTLGAVDCIFNAVQATRLILSSGRPAFCAVKTEQKAVLCVRLNCITMYSYTLNQLMLSLVRWCKNTSEP